ncbi:hypothetical protein SO694_00031386 [Aureococcus anophagefferens]|uniref:TFIIS central domain-containing protein n=1 Tax=Aureococcus anophagefferens TaxID=44056 RepID=A0ABR1FJP5_AURAN
MSTPPPSTPSAPRSAAVLSVDEAIARGAKAASLATGDAPTMPPALDLKTRGASVHDIARRLGELQSVSPESQLDMARKMETSCFDAAKSVEDYKKKIDKRLAKAAKVLAAAAGRRPGAWASRRRRAPRPAPPAAPQKRAASPAPPRATPTPPPRAPTPGLWCDKLGQRKATLDAQLGACLERYAPKTLADVDVAAEVEKRLEDGDGVLALPRALPAVASLSLHRCGDYVATVPCDGFRAAVFLDRSGPDRSVVDVVVKALEISEAAPASRHALWRRVTADVDAAVPDLLRATPPGPRREPRLVAAVLAAVAKAKAARLETAAEDDGPPRDLSGPRPPIPAGAPEACVPS